jgi:hypothetical protein
VNRPVSQSSSRPIGCRTIPCRVLGLAAILGVLCVLSSGCSSFNRHWHKAAQTPPPVGSIEGRWEGRWLSDMNGHTGHLRCLLTRKEGSVYAARFRATYWKVFRYSYEVDLLFEERDGVWNVRGKEDLGWLAGGVYHYAGCVTATNFSSTYRSKYDHGTFEMHRP